MTKHHPDKPVYLVALLAQQDINDIGVKHGLGTYTDETKTAVMWFDADLTQFARAVESAVVRTKYVQQAIYCSRASHHLQGNEKQAMKFTPEEVAQMAREAGCVDPMVFAASYQRLVAIVAKKAAQAERQACKAACESIEANQGRACPARNNPTPQPPQKGNS